MLIVATKGSPIIGAVMINKVALMHVKSSFIYLGKPNGLGLLVEAVPANVHNNTFADQTSRVRANMAVTDQCHIFPLTCSAMFF